ncbi:MAG: hypothetical protein ACI8RD_006290 [Bacillariaceae sp.]|jgi:hypothetical protein
MLSVISERKGRRGGMEEAVNVPELVPPRIYEQFTDEYLPKQAILG